MEVSITSYVVAVLGPMVLGIFGSGRGVPSLLTCVRFFPKDFSHPPGQPCHLLDKSKTSFKTIARDFDLKAN